MTKISQAQSAELEAVQIIQTPSGSLLTHPSPPASTAVTAEAPAYSWTNRIRLRFHDSQFEEFGKRGAAE